MTREDLDEIRRKSKCKICGGRLTLFIDMDVHKAYLACNSDQSHEGIEREASRYEKEGLSSLNIKTRREIMAEEIGEGKTTALAKYIGGGVITKRIATEIIESLWGGAPAIEKTKCILLCQTYQLNPLMKHLHLVGYKRRGPDKKFIVDGQGKPVLDWSIMIGIGATRLLAQRKHNYSYLDMTPRKATEDEIRKILGDTADSESIYGFTHIKDVDTGAEAFGLRGIKRDENIKGVEKGNTHLNMACVRSERLALDRQYPGEMPPNVEVVDERYIEGEYKMVDHGTGEITEHIAEEPEATPESKPKQHWCQEHNCAFEKKHSRYGDFYSHKLPDGSYCKENKKKATAPKAAPHIPESTGELPSDEPKPGPESVEEKVGLIIKSWLEESLKTLQSTGLKGWTESSLLSYMRTSYGVEASTVLEAAAKLDEGKAAHFVKRIQETLDMA